MAKKRIDRNDIAPKDVFKNIEEGARDAKKRVDMLEESLKMVQNIAKSSKVSIANASPKDVKSIKELNNLTAVANKNAKNKLQIDKDLLKERERLNQLQREQKKDLKDTIALESKEAGTLQKVAASSRKLRQEREKLNLKTKEGKRRLVEINKQIDKNNKFIEKNSDKMKKQRLGIGRYTKALSGLRNVLGKLGLAFGAFTLIRDSFNVIKDFQQSTANLASVLADATAPQLERLNELAKELGATTKFTASQVSELQTELAKLGFSPKQIEDMSRATLELAAASGVELAEAATVAGATLRGFGLEATDTQRVVDVMAKSFSSSSLDMSKFGTAMAAVAPVAKQFGFSIEETTAMVGTLTDSGIDASTAGTALRNMMLDANKAGLTFNEALEKVNNSADKTGAAFDLFGKRGATTGVILAESAAKVGELTGKLEEAKGSAKEMADKQLETLSGSLALLRSAWEGQILAMDEAGGVGEKLRNIIGFLAKNLSTILSVLGKVTKAFIIFKATMFALKMKDQIANFKAFGKSAKKAGENLTDAEQSAKGFGKALKGIGITAAIALLAELATQLYDVASGAAEARVAMEKFNKGVSNGNEKVDELNAALKANRESMIKGGATEEEANKASIKSIKIMIEKAKLKRDEAIAEKERYKAIREGQVLSGEDAEIQAATLKVIRQKTQDEAAFKTVIAGLKDTWRELNGEMASNSQITEDNTNATKDNKEEKEKVLAVTSRLNRVEEEKVDIFSDLVTTGEELHQSDLQRKVDLAEIALLEAEIAGDDEEIIKRKIQLIEARRDAENALEKDGAKRRLNELKAEKEINDLTAKNDEEKYERQKEYIDLLTDYFTKRADERIKKREEELEAAQKQSDHLRALAENGNITAKESLAEQNRLIAEANAQKAEEEKRKQRILLVSSVLQAYNANLSAGDESGEAFTKAITSTAVLTQFVNALPAFLEGTEDTGANGKGVDGKGGFHAILHPNERVMTKEQNAMLGSYSNEEVARIMEQHRLGKYVDGSQVNVGWDNQLLVQGLMNVESKLDQVNKTIENKPETNIELGRITSTAMNIVERKTQGKITTVKTFKVQ